MRSISDTLARLAAMQPPIAPKSGRLVELPDFGSNPGALSGWYYVPAKLKPAAPLVVALHGCLQTAAGYDNGTGWSALAEQAGFAMLVPEQRRSNNANLCFTWFEPDDIARSGGEAESIAQMVVAMVETHGLDREKIFVTGLSAGGAMAAVMLSTYPDLFAAGAIIGGLAYGSATSVAQAIDRMRGHGAPSDADAERAVAHASMGIAHRPPRISIWQGSDDTTVVPSNADRIAGQWRAVHRLGITPNETRRGPNWEHAIWRDGDARAAVETWRIAGMGHGVPIDPSGPTHLGRSGPYMLDIGLSSTHAIAASWGLVAAEPIKPAAPIAPPSPLGDVQDMLQAAFRSAGLLR